MDTGRLLDTVLCRHTIDNGNADSAQRFRDTPYILK